jgi:N-acetylglucosaminyl-diphospho-decaprenol L-rhamnosyltransferase
MTTVDLAIVIVSYNAREDLEACLSRLRDDPPRATHQTVVVDNASTDGSAGAARAYGPAVRVIDAGENLGFARGTNVGIAATDSRLILLLNSDTLPSPGAIDRLIAVLDARNDVAVAGPRLVDGAGRLEISFGSMITPWAEAWQKTLGRAYAAGVPGLTALVERRTRQARLVDWISGACLLVRRTDAEAVNGLDERFFLYTEDVDFCASVRARGRHVLFTPDVEMVHRRGRSGRRAPAATAMAYRRSHLVFYRKHHPRWYPLLRLYLRVRGLLPPEA